ncbi:20731_t:CDS:1, partial [Cetraspora pellucida]
MDLSSKYQWEEKGTLSDQHNLVVTLLQRKKSQPHVRPYTT